ncbi:MAG: site-2 protease family protein [Gemmatimonadales bacterium]|jgi:membrane-associated protease RseP (regulator of RpoE activity)|nr:site-2 protease family protein [Gemmatimonadales bacterium]
MALRKAGKPDPGLWLTLLEEYRLTSLPNDTLLEGTLREDLSGASPEVQDAIREWPAAAHLHYEDGRTQVALVYHAKDERSRGPWIHLALFAATMVTTMAAGALMVGLDPFDTEVLRLGALAIPYPSGLNLRALWVGVPFAFPFLGVLLAHEMGHYVAARVHKVRATLPYFIPCPPYFSIIGTLGAFIKLKGPTIKRAVLFDVGAAGPLASFVVSLPLLGIGLMLSEVVPGRATGSTPFVIQFAGQSVWLGNGVITHVMGSIFAPGVLGEAPILLHPLALVGWLGLFVTALNLLPLGQLDGGHILYALAPKQQSRASKVFMVALLPLGFLWWGWWAWAALIAVLHRGRMNHPPVVQPEKHIGLVRRWLGFALVLIFFLTFVPVPLDL